MKCVICKQGITRPGETTLTLERDGLTFVVKKVPASVCDNCGEAYVDEKTTADLLESAEQLAQSGTVVDIRSFIAA
jgi:YgiT-type zinc finger domain-containing protein